ncbi:MAG TPA: hypothetical protein VL284_12845 [Thermoanaerobaculia bacterium]|nr:hypothetical protein [Thermoanaerobaculia bacterium]
MPSGRAFWSDLTSVDSVDERRARIEQFFFDGIDGFEPLLMPSHFTRESGGGIRTAQLSGSRRMTRFYQFQLQIDA